MNQPNLTSLIGVGAVKTAFVRLLQAAKIITRPEDVLSFNKNIGDVIPFQAQTVSALTSINFFDNTTGLSGNFNVQGGFRSANEHIAVYAIRICSAVSATLSASDWAPGLTEATAQNGTLTLTVAGTNVLRSIPLDIFNGDGSESSELGVYNLNAPILIPAQQPVTANISLPAAGLLNLNVKIELLSFGLFS
ncbi:MAG: hypothetical protein H7836_14255 [Magnetococcus sp. YQC-3]